MNRWSLALALGVASAVGNGVWPSGTMRAQVPGRCEVPASQRTSEVGCWVAASTPVGPFAEERVYWHLYTAASRAAAEAVVPHNGTVVDAFGKTWMFVLTNRDWRPPSGDRVDVVGPLEVTAGRPYVARYLEATIPAGERTPVHTHAGPEAWHVLSGAQCLETPTSITVMRAGQSAVVQQGPPMLLSSVGPETRQTLVLVLHDAQHSWTEPHTGWTPPGACPP